MTWNIPNILTVLRLISAPGVALAFLFLPRPFADWAALILFVGAAVTDWFDGYLARKWNQTSRFGAMLDPIADKAMVVIALMVVVAVTGMPFLITLPTTLILFREVFVSGLREFLGDKAGLLQVTKLAKWKTTVQMLAIAVLLANGIFEHEFGMRSMGMDRAMIAGVLDGSVQDTLGLRFHWAAMGQSWTAGIALIWLAAILTFVTGWDYFVKSLPYLRDGGEDD